MATDLFTAAREARDEAITRVESNAEREWFDAALVVIRDLAIREATIHPDDARAAITAEVGEPHEWRVLGPLLMAAAREGWIERTNIRRMSERPTNHGHERRIWASLLYRPNGYELHGREKKAGRLARAVMRAAPDTDPADLAAAAADLSPDWWRSLAEVIGEKHPPSDATICRVIEILSEREAA